jgi:hypothetical protein
VDILNICMKYLAQPQNMTSPLMSNICWLASNYSKLFKPAEKNDEELKLLFIFQSGLFTETLQIVTDCLWGLSYLSNTQDDKLITSIASGEVLPKVISNLDVNNELCLSVPAIRTIANISTCDDNFVIEKAIFEGVIPRLLTYFDGGSKYSSMISEVCWTYSNLFANGNDTIRHVFEYNNGEVFKKIFEKIHSKSNDVAKESLWAILNALTECDSNLRVRQLQQFGEEIIETLIIGFKQQ